MSLFGFAEAEHGYASMLPFTSSKDRDGSKRKIKSKKNCSSRYFHLYNNASPTDLLVLSSTVRTVATVPLARVYLASEYPHTPSYWEHFVHIRDSHISLDGTRVPRVTSKSADLNVSAACACVTETYSLIHPRADATRTRRPTFDMERDVRSLLSL